MGDTDDLDGDYNVIEQCLRQTQVCGCGRYGNCRDNRYVGLGMVQAQ